MLIDQVPAFVMPRVASAIISLLGAMVVIGDMKALRHVDFDVAWSTCL